MIIIGLTGSIGMGKSTAAQIFRAHAIPVHDADDAVHQMLTSDHTIIKKILETFNDCAGDDGTIDRKKLGQIVFHDPHKLKQLEAILHPAVRSKTDQFLKDCLADQKPLVVLDIPLLYETSAERRVDAVLCVTAPEHIQRARVLGRPGMTEEKLETILKQQMPDTEKRAQADFILEMHHGMDQAEQDIKKLIETFKTLKAEKYKRLIAS